MCYGKAIVLVLLIFSVCSSLSAQEVITVKWPTKHASAPIKVAKDNQLVLKMIRAGVDHLPETQFMQFSSSGAAFLGLKSKAANQLGKSVSSYYKRMQDEFDKEKFPPIPSAVSYCYSEKKLSSGYANVYVPKLANKSTPVIVFLHGYGGSFSFYLHYLATSFPESIIICPAYGISMANVPDAYLRECVAKVSAKLAYPLFKPVLIGLSAGGTGGFKHYARYSDDYLGFISVVSPPPKDVLHIMPKDAKIRLIAGGDEAYVTDRTLSHRIKKLKLTSKEVKVVKDQGHFLMLEDEENTREWLEKTVKSLRLLK